MKRLSWGLFIVSLVLTGVPVGRAATPEKPADAALETIELFKKADPKMQKLFETAQGYVIFPAVSKGAAGIGAAHGVGKVYERGKLIGTAKLSQITVGLQLGGQEYSEVIFFETAAALEQFKSMEWAMSAQASAVAAADGASTNAKYQQGVLVFTLVKTGLMFEASVGGQKFKYKPIAQK